MVAQFLTLYSPNAPRFSNITALASDLGWTPVIASTAAEYFDTQGVGRLFTRELVDAATRVNYGQDVDTLHALEGMCSLAAENAASVRGGNFQVFAQFLARSNATVHLKTEVTSLVQDAASGAWLVGTGGTTRSRGYRGVILAAPFHSAAIELSQPALIAPVPEQPYVRLHVTLLSTTASAPNASYFSLTSGRAPMEVLTTNNRVREGLGEGPEFNSMTYHGKVKRADGTPSEREEWSVKIFSKQKIENAWLENMFGAGNVGWVLRKEVSFLSFVRAVCIKCVPPNSGMPTLYFPQRPPSHLSSSPKGCTTSTHLNRKHMRPISTQFGSCLVPQASSRPWRPKQLHRGMSLTSCSTTNTMQVSALLPQQTKTRGHTAKTLFLDGTVSYAYAAVGHSP